jgi:hypothetical protein
LGNILKITKKPMKKSISNRKTTKLDKIYLNSIKIPQIPSIPKPTHSGLLKNPIEGVYRFGVVGGV